eukprot:TRINITY_DN30490_c0_g2_i3.p1 TRINITY_DN30490_c0_g2~~TRINITY_DN30490_c0_g2_i3.p1  ORF type:complete len:265 (+),score=24.41 TRINITY_DN30490_c0_g2_i3:247-1041(+)
MLTAEAVEWVVPTPDYTAFSMTKQWVSPSSFDKVVMYMHGGAYVLCCPGSLRGITYHLSRELNMPLCCPEYRKPPEHPAPAQLEDAVLCYKHLLQTWPAEKIVIAGESAGGGILAVFLANLRDADLPKPACAVLISPWVDLGGDGLRNVSLHNEPHDYLPKDLISWIAEQARTGNHGDDWLVSPTHADGCLRSLPPTLVCYGLDEVLCGQVEEFCKRWTAKGAPLVTRPVQGGVHAPVLFSFCDEESKRALADIAQFVHAHVSR